MGERERRARPVPDDASFAWVQFRRVRRQLGRAAAAAMAPALLRVLARTWRTEVLGAERLTAVEAEGRGHFMALWHGRMLVGLPHHARRDYLVLVSPSGDGDISEALLKSFGYRVLRGSSSRSGAETLRALRDALGERSVVVVTPDGPRGPRHSMNPGLAWLSRATGSAVVPCGFVCDRAWHTRSWDAFTVPKPRARVVLAYGEPIRVGRAGGDVELTEATERIREGILGAEQRAFDHLGVSSDG